MLYDKRWDKQIKADPLTIESLIAWLEKRDPKATYRYEDCEGGCLYGQYMAAMGFPWLEACGKSNNTAIGAFESQVYYDVASEKPRTFGAALERARKLAA